MCINGVERDEREWKRIFSDVGLGDLQDHAGVGSLLSHRDLPMKALHGELDLILMDTICRTRIPKTQHVRWYACA